MTELEDEVICRRGFSLAYEHCLEDTLNTSAGIGTSFGEEAQVQLKCRKLIPTQKLLEQRVTLLNVLINLQSKLLRPPPLTKRTINTKIHRSVIYLLPPFRKTRFLDLLNRLNTPLSFIGQFRSCLFVIGYLNVTGINTNDGRIKATYQRSLETRSRPVIDSPDTTNSTATVNRCSHVREYTTMNAYGQTVRMVSFARSR